MDQAFHPYFSFGTAADAAVVPSPALAGRKGHMLALMASLGLPVPPGIIIPVDAVAQLSAKDSKALQALVLPAFAGLYSNSSLPLLLAVRTSATQYIPGLPEAVLNIGLNDETVERLAKAVGDEPFAFECYRRFIQNYGHVVMGDDPSTFEDVLTLYMGERGYVSATELQGSDARELASRFKEQFESNNGIAFPQSPEAQLHGAVAAMSRAWDAPRAKTSRKLQGHGAEMAGLAIVVQLMVHSNLSGASGVGQVTTRNAQSGEAQVKGFFLANGFGQDLDLPLPARQTLAAFENNHQDAFKALSANVATLEKTLREGIEAVFALEQGELWMLSAKPAKKSTNAAVRLAIDFVEQGLMSKEEALLRIDPLSLDQLLHSTIDPDTKRVVIATGLPASPGAVSGLIIFDAEEARQLASQGRRVILVRPETLPEDVRGLHAADGVLTTRGGITSHAAVIARGMGKPCVTGASALKIDPVEGTLVAPGLTLKRWDVITIDGSTGQILQGAVPTEKPELSGGFATLLEWADEFRRMRVRANAETPQDASLARSFGAEGIGLCRTEHMFFEGERLVAMREMILADRERDRRAALTKVLPLLRADFEKLFEVMSGLPITLRLLDPPLHEFLPEGGAEVDAVARSLEVDPQALRKRVSELKEQNPMLGHRGVRLLLSYPEIVDMQARAIFEAVAAVGARTGEPPVPEIMVPLVVSRAELDLVRSRIDATAAAVRAETGTDFSYRVGTMIELPRAALRAADIAASAEFFSFGTNDLTQTTFGISRDDAARYIADYQSKGILPVDPFVSLDVDGVGELLELAVERGRSTRPDIHLGICGEHGGDPDSIAFCEQTGLDYVSCSPFRVPIARLAAAQATLRKSN